MVEIYRDLFVITCILLLGWSLIRLERVYQFPFFMGTIFISFLHPQILALIDNPGAVSPKALERVLLMSWLCLAACGWGYQLKPNANWLAKLYIPVDESKLFKAGLALLGLGYLCNIILSRITIQATEFGTWTGPATILYFFAQVIYIAFAIFLVKALKHPNIANITCAIFASIPPLNAIIFSGRRQPTMTFLVVVGFSFWLARRYIPPRWIFILAVVAITYLIPLVGQLRGEFWTLLFNRDWTAIQEASQIATSDLLEGETLELRNAALLMEAADTLNRYKYGTGYWDALVFQFVPGQLVGFAIKNGLQFQWGAIDLTELFGYAVPAGTTVTGVGDTFLEFSYLGFLVFALMAHVFKYLWISAIYHNSRISGLLYVGLISPAMVGITHGTSRFAQEALFQLIFVGLVAYYARVRLAPIDSSISELQPYSIHQSPNL